MTLITWHSATGKHYIDVKEINAGKREIFTNEHGSLTKTWNHRILVEPLSESALRYTDEIEAAQHRR